MTTHQSFLEFFLFTSHFSLFTSHFFPCSSVDSVAIQVFRFTSHGSRFTSFVFPCGSVANNVGSAALEPTYENRSFYFSLFSVFFRGFRGHSIFVFYLSVFFRGFRGHSIFGSRLPSDI